MAVPETGRIRTTSMEENSGREDSGRHVQPPGALPMVEPPVPQREQAHALRVARVRPPARARPGAMGGHSRSPAQARRLALLGRAQRHRLVGGQALAREPGGRALG